MPQLSDFYKQAKDFIEHHLKLPESGEAILEAELVPYRTGKSKPESMDEPGGIYYKMLESLKNRQGFENFIGLDAVECMNDILFGYDPIETHKTYGNDLKDGLNSGLFEKLERQFFGKNKKFDIKNPKNAWVQYTKGIISIARFLSDFQDAKDKGYKKFCGFIELFSSNADEHVVAALPMLLEKEIDGYGFALACDFLKESGYNMYCKPDVHLLDIFWQGRLLTKKINTSASKPSSKWRAKSATRL